MFVLFKEHVNTYQDGGRVLGIEVDLRPSILHVFSRTLNPFDDAHEI